SGSKADVKAAAAAAVATKGASSKLGTALDDIVANLMHSVGDVLQGHVQSLLDEVKEALGAPTGDGEASRSGFASYSGTRTTVPQLADTDTHPASLPNGTDGSASHHSPPVERAD